MTNRTLIFDFDSTFIQSESLETLFDILIEGKPNQEEIAKSFAAVTELAMNGQFSFRESLDSRLKGLRIHKSDVEEANKKLKNQITTSFVRNKAFFQKNKDSIYIMSGGFIEMIWPIVKDFGIRYDHVFANRFLYDHEGWVIDFDRNHFLSQDGGKVFQVQALKLDSSIVIIGDGYNDYEVRAAGCADSFFAFCENIERSHVIEKADGVFKNLEGVFVALGIETPPVPQRKKALLLENIHPYVEHFLKANGFDVETLKGSLSGEALIAALKDVNFLGVRSKTNIDATILACAPHLEAIGAFCIGTNHIDLKSSLKQGVAVFNAPFSNTRSVVELALAEMIMLFRNIQVVNQQCHQGVWEKSSQHSYEVRGKTLGIIGYGNIGAQLSVLAENLGMQVLYYDIIEKLPLGNAKACHTMVELLSQADVVTVHVDGRATNTKLINKDALSQMKAGSYLMNLSRGSVVDLEALEQALQTGHIRAAALDVFPQEPSMNQDGCTIPLMNYPQVILTPHIGGSTLEAQESIGQFVANRLHEYAALGSTLHSVNFPQVQLSAFNGSHRIIHIHENVPGILAQINSLLASHKLNIEGQYLKTNETVGYVITDVNAMNGDGFIEDLKKIKHTIKVRVLY